MQCKSFMWILLDTLTMKKLIDKYGIRTVQCKAACLFIIDCLKNHFINNNDEMARLAKENSRYISYYYRMHVFNSGSQQSNAINLHSNNSKFIILNQAS